MHPLSRQAVELRTALADIGCKWCPKCSRVRHRSHFNRQASTPDGLQKKCAECGRAASSEWCARNRERNTERHRAWVAGNPERAAELARSYRARPDAKARHAARATESRGTVAGALRNRVTTRIHAVLRKGSKGGARTEALVGWTFAELRTHLERQFTAGMNWENMGEWHIDHIVPLRSFTITGPHDPEFRRAWALTNLRPLWAKDNLSKHDKRVSLL
jgi:hypothetical protein